jgi:hypothetical protein
MMPLDGATPRPANPLSCLVYHIEHHPGKAQGLPIGHERLPRVPSPPVRPTRQALQTIKSGPPTLRGTGSLRPVLATERKAQRQTASRLPKGRHRSAHYGSISTTSLNLKV